MDIKKPWKDLGSDIIKLEGYGLYITYLDDEYFESEILAGSGHPELDQDGGINWSAMKEPPNQRFLNLLNARFGTSVTMSDYGGMMSIREVKEFVSEQEGKQKKAVPSEASLRWLVKNMRERG